MKLNKELQKNFFKVCLPNVFVWLLRNDFFNKFSKKNWLSWGDGPIYKVGTPYKINGKWYYPAVNYDYDENWNCFTVWARFSTEKTANGEVFDQKNKITAAHKTLPMPSIVKVTNLEKWISAG